MWIQEPQGDWQGQVSLYSVAPVGGTVGGRIVMTREVIKAGMEADSSDSLVTIPGMPPTARRAAPPAPAPVTSPQPRPGAGWLTSSGAAGRGA